MALLWVGHIEEVTLLNQHSHSCRIIVPVSDEETEDERG